MVNAREEVGRLLLAIAVEIFMFSGRERGWGRLRREGGRAVRDIVVEEMGSRGRGRGW